MPTSPSELADPCTVTVPMMDILPFTPGAAEKSGLQESADGPGLADNAMLIPGAAMLEGSTDVHITPQQPALEFSFDTGLSREATSPEAFERMLVVESAPITTGPMTAADQAHITLESPPTAETTVALEVVSGTPAALPAPRSAAKSLLTPARAASGRITPAAAAKRTPMRSVPAAATPVTAAATTSKKQSSSVTAEAPTRFSQRQTPSARSSATSSTVVSAARPASAAPRSSLRVPSTAVAAAAETKRVSICSPPPASAVRASSATRPLVCTPHPKSGKGGDLGPVAWPAEAMDTDGFGSSPALPSPPPKAVSADEPDASMILAAALPPSSRTTAEEVAPAGLPPAVIVTGAMGDAGVHAEPQLMMRALALSALEDSMEVDAIGPPSAYADGDQSFSSASLLHGTPGPNTVHVPTVASPIFSSVIATAAPKLTFPVAVASYMSGTKSSLLKASPGTVGLTEANNYKPRVKSMVVGNNGDDRYAAIILACNPVYYSESDEL